MKILLYSLVFAPDGVSTSDLISKLAVELQSLGHEITVLTTTPHYNIDLDIRHEQPLVKAWGPFLYKSDYQGIPVHHIPVGQKSGSMISRLFNYLKFHLFSLIFGIFDRRQYDLVFTLSPPLTIGLIAWIFSKRYQVPFVYNVQEIYPDIAVEMGLLRNGAIISVMEKIEVFIYARARSIAVISEQFQKKLIDKGVEKSKIAMIPNFVDTEFNKPGQKMNGFSERQDLAEKFIILYAGNMGLTQDFDSVLASARKLADYRDILFLFVGGGAQLSWLEESISDLSVENISLLPYQPKSVVPDLYASADLCLIPMQKGTSGGTFPSKVYTIMSSSRPVLASTEIGSDLASIIQTAECGMVIPPEDEQAMVEGILRFYHNPELKHISGKNGRDYVVRYHQKSVIAREYAKLFKDTLK